MTTTGAAAGAIAGAFGLNTNSLATGLKTNSLATGFNVLLTCVVAAAAVDSGVVEDDPGAAADG